MAVCVLGGDICGRGDLDVYEVLCLTSEAVTVQIMLVPSQGYTSESRGTNRSDAWR